MKIIFRIVLAALFCTPPSARGGHAGGADSLVGLWGAELIIAPTLRGELIVDARDPGWRVRFGGFEAPLLRAGDTVAFTLPGGNGEFRGHLGGDSALIRGHWIQPATINPYGQRYASPVELRHAGRGVWRGTVSPLEYRISFYLSIRRGADGTRTAFIKNPEANFFAGRTYAVSVSGDSILLAHPNVPEAGIIDRATDRLLIPLLYAYPPLIFTRRGGDDAVGYFPRTPGSGRYVYEPPLADSDGWRTGTLTEAGIDQGAMEALVEKIVTSAPDPDNPLNIQGLLIARHDKLVFEEYFYGFEKDRTHDMRSASKTIAPILVGIARDHGAPIAPDSRVASLFPNDTPFAHSDARKARITVEDLMNMASGLAIDDADPSSPGNEGRLQEQTEQPDWYKYTLDLPMVRDPGGDHPVYGSANTNLVGGALRNATGTWLPEFFDAYLARPLGIRTYQMNLMPTGEAYAGGGLYMRARDQLKIGQLYLDGGQWNGRRVVSGEWVNRSTRRRGDMTPRMPLDVGHGYGYAWHFRDVRVGERTLHYYWAGGNGGQLIIVLPELDMVVGFSGGDYAEFRKYLRWEIELLPQAIIPAVRQ